MRKRIHQNDRARRAAYDSRKPIFRVTLAERDRIVKARLLATAAKRNVVTTFEGLLSRETFHQAALWLARRFNARNAGFSRLAAEGLLATCHLPLATGVCTRCGSSKAKIVKRWEWASNPMLRLECPRCGKIFVTHCQKSLDNAAKADKRGIEASCVAD